MDPDFLDSVSQPTHAGLESIIAYYTKDIAALTQHASEVHGFMMTCLVNESVEALAEYDAFKANYDFVMWQINQLRSLRANMDTLNSLVMGFRNNSERMAEEAGLTPARR
jgi:hypothetical protein